MEQIPQDEEMTTAKNTAFSFLATTTSTNGTRWMNSGQLSKWNLL